MFPFPHDIHNTVKQLKLLKMNVQYIASLTSILIMVLSVRILSDDKQEMYFDWPNMLFIFADLVIMSGE